MFQTYLYFSAGAAVWYPLNPVSIGSNPRVPCNMVFFKTDSALTQVPTVKACHNAQLQHKPTNDSFSARAFHPSVNLSIRAQRQGSRNISGSKHTRGRGAGWGWGVWLTVIETHSSPLLFGPVPLCSLGSGCPNKLWHAALSTGAGLQGRGGVALCSLIIRSCPLSSGQTEQPASLIPPAWLRIGVKLPIYLPPLCMSETEWSACDHKRVCFVSRYVFCSV